MKSTLSISLIAFYCSSFSIMASEDYICNYNGDKRIISITYESDQQPVPCQVQYDKGAGMQILWSAQSEVGYCETIANKFLQKQESWGWSCEKMSQSVSETEIPVEDSHTFLY